MPWRRVEGNAYLSPSDRPVSRFNLEHVGTCDCVFIRSPFDASVQFGPLENSLALCVNPHIVFTIFRLRIVEIGKSLVSKTIAFYGGQGDHSSPLKELEV